MSVTSNTEVQTSEEVNINEIIKPYLRKWWWFVLSAVTLLAIAVFYIKTATPVYNITSTVLIKDTKKAPSSDMAMLSDRSGMGSMGTNSMENEIEVLKSKKLMQDVVTSLGLQTVLLNKNGLTTTELYGSSAPVLVTLISEKNSDKQSFAPLLLRITGSKVELESEDLPKQIV